MKIYLAGNFPVMKQKGRERELANKFPKWPRLFSFYFKKLIYKSEILIIKQENAN